MLDFTKLASKAAEAGLDQTKAKVGADFDPPAEGPCRLRLISYIELGKHTTEFAGKPKTSPKVVVQFEVSGPKHPARIGDDGVKHPHIITIRETLSQSNKARWFKLFTLLNYAGGATHAVALIGNAYKGRIIHRKYKTKTGEEKVVAELYDRASGSYTIEPPRYEVVDPESGPTGEYAPLKVDPAISDNRVFLWEIPDMEQWGTLFIDGTYEERKNDKGEVTAPAKSKNVWQNTIKSAVNFKGSPIYLLLESNGQSLDLPAPEHVDDDGAEEEDDAPKAPAKAEKTVPTGAAADDALGGIA